MFQTRLVARARYGRLVRDPLHPHLTQLRQRRLQEVTHLDKDKVLNGKTTIYKDALKIFKNTFNGSLFADSTEI